MDFHSLFEKNKHLIKQIIKEKMDSTFISRHLLDALFEKLIEQKTIDSNLLSNDSLREKSKNELDIWLQNNTSFVEILENYTYKTADMLGGGNIVTKEWCQINK